MLVSLVLLKLEQIYLNLFCLFAMCYICLIRLKQID